MYFDGWRRMFNLKDKSTRAEFWSFSIVNFIFIYHTF